MSSNYTIEHLDPKILLPNPKNYRQHGAAQREALASSIEDFGWLSAPIFNKTTGLLIDGHARVEHALRSGEKTIPVRVLHVDAKTEAHILASFDKIGEMRETDDVALCALLRGICDEGDPPIGWDAEEVGNLMLALAGAGDEDAEEIEARPEIGEEADEIPEEVETRAKAGDLWQLGQHRLAVGSSTDRDLVTRLLGDEEIRMVWTDPPYGVSYADKNKFLNEADGGKRSEKPIQNDALSLEETEDLCKTALFHACDHAMRGASVYVACPAGTPLPHFIAAVAGSGFQYKWGLVWVKNNWVLGRSDYHFQHENILYGWKDGPHYFVDEHNHSSVFEVPKPHRADLHPTMKPVALIAQMVRNSSKPGEIVYDPFGGSGSTLIACEELGRKARLVELSAHYCDVIIARFEKMTGETALRIDP